MLGGESRPCLRRNLLDAPQQTVTFSCSREA
jgi:hypothetical protein